MIVKVTTAKAESLYECDRVHVRPDLDNCGAPERFVVFDLENDSGKAISLKIERAQGAEVFVMNNQGQTVDRYNLRCKS